MYNFMTIINHLFIFLKKGIPLFFFTKMV